MTGTRPVSYLQPLEVRNRISHPQPCGAPDCEVLRDAPGRAWGLDPANLICGNGSEELLDVGAH